MKLTPAVLVGQAIGDALGMPFEKLSDEVHPDLATWDGSYQPGTWHKLPAGHWTDDTEMGECLASSLIACHGFDGADVARRYLAWSQATPHGMGGTTRAAMEKLAQGADWRSSGSAFDDPNKVGSAPPMRAAPIGAIYQHGSAIFDACKADAYITHADPEAIAASAAVAMTVRRVLQGVDPRAVLPFVLEALRVKLGCPLTRVESSLIDAHTALGVGQASPEQFAQACAGRRGNAWQITSSAIYSALWAESFRDGVIAAVKIGGDADTRGAIAGAILGARFGLEGIPAEYKAGLLRLDDLAKLDRALPRGLTQVGFCSKCSLIRQDDAIGPVTPCACFVVHHATDCRLRIAIRCPIALACEDHGWDSCPTCFSCTCGVDVDRMFVCGAAVFAWELGIGLVPRWTAAVATP